MTGNVKFISVRVEPICSVIIFAIPGARDQEGKVLALRTMARVALSLHPWLLLERRTRIELEPRRQVRSLGPKFYYAHMLNKPGLITISSSHPRLSYRVFFFTINSIRNHPGMTGSFRGDNAAAYPLAAVCIVKFRDGVSSSLDHEEDVLLRVFIN
jgi:hypothetical protein